jgi:hypothetical protein
VATATSIDVHLALCRKSFIETRSIAAVAVAFSRVYILHAMLLFWMTMLVSVCVCRVLSAECYAFLPVGAK